MHVANGHLRSPVRHPFPYDDRISRATLRCRWHPHALPGTDEACFTDEQTCRFRWHPCALPTMTVLPKTPYLPLDDTHTHYRRRRFYQRLPIFRSTRPRRTTDEDGFTDNYHTYLPLADTHKHYRRRRFYRRIYCVGRCIPDGDHEAMTTCRSHMVAPIRTINSSTIVSRRISIPPVFYGLCTRYRRRRLLGLSLFSILPTVTTFAVVAVACVGRSGGAYRVARGQPSGAVDLSPAVQLAHGLYASLDDPCGKERCKQREEKKEKVHNTKIREVMIHIIDMIGRLNKGI